MTILVTGAAGFIGAHVVRGLLARGERVLGVDSLNAYYDPALKEARLRWIGDAAQFKFERCDIAEPGALARACAGEPIDRIVHLAAQAGVRYSLENPMAYAQANVTGHLAVLECARALPALRHLVYASSSSVYGGNTKLPFAESDPVDRPVSLYAATKKADELMSHTYSHLFGLKQTGLRFFTVYGPWGRPDMAYWQFTAQILKGEPIAVFNHGDMKRDFTYVDDVTEGVIACLDHPPGAGKEAHRIFNIGNNKPEALTDFIAILETLLGRKAVCRFEPMQPGDVKETFADITALAREIGFVPKTPLAEGLARFVAWFRDFYGA
jgi:UDP-glucuronate 4-epimerase